MSRQKIMFRLTFSFKKKRDIANQMRSNINFNPNCSVRYPPCNMQIFDMFMCANSREKERERARVLYVSEIAYEIWLKF